MKSFVIKTAISLTIANIFLLPAPSYAATTTPTSNAEATSPSKTPVGRVVWVKGNFSATETKEKTPRALQKLSIIYLKDTLTTGSGSQAQIAFTDNSLMTFKPNSKFLIDQYQFNPQKPASVGRYVMNLIQGGFRTITGLIAKNKPGNYQIKTPVATIGVRGTDYAVYIDQGELFIGNYSGQPCVDNKKGSLCLDDKRKYAQVKSEYIAPVPLSQAPTGFKEKLEIVPARIAYSPSGGTMPGGGFCIIQ